MKKKIKKLNRAKKVKKIKESDVATLYYTASKFLIPRLRKFNKICVSYPINEDPESWFEKIDFIANSLEARIKDDFYDLTWEEQSQIKINADKASKMLGEIWFDLWS
jgi:glutamine cyclotransferase